VPHSPPAQHPDAATIAALRAGDHTVFGEVVKELTPGLTRLARTYVPEAIADEVVQETWMAVIKSINTFEGRSALKTWIYRIMLNKVRTVAVRESKIVPFTSIGPNSSSDRPSVEPDRLVHPELGQGYWPEAPARWDSLPAERLEALETAKHIEEAVSSLPAAQREVLTLRDIEGWSAEEVCNALGISSVNQRVLLHRGRVTVRETLEDYLS
jgi:RNA polymerase sigma-70 factor (ECF subfamily)